MNRKSVSRRRFLQSAGAAAVAVPTSVKGYTAAEMRSFSSDDVMELDVSKWELDTPALCVDLDALEANLTTLQETVSRNGIASRPHAKTHKCPAIARMQMESGSVGICTAKVSEAIAMYEHGIDQIVLTSTGSAFANPAAHFSTQTFFDFPNIPLFSRIPVNVD